MQKSRFEEALDYLKGLNPRWSSANSRQVQRPHNLKKVVVANRGEIAKRFFLSFREEGITSVAIVADVDSGQSWYEYADEVIQIGALDHYTNIPIVVAAALMVEANAIYPGYGFLSENSDFVRAIKSASELFNHEIIFMGPDDSVMDRVGDKLDARALALEHNVPLFKGSASISTLDDAIANAEKIGYPVIIKLNKGGGGKGMVPVYASEEMKPAIASAQRIGKSLYGDDTFYLEKYIEKPVHIEVQIFNGTAVGVRKCAVQRRNQKVVEESGEKLLDSYLTLSLLSEAEKMARISGYSEGMGAGTVEFLLDPDASQFGFLEMNTRLQVEHPVTEQGLGVDLVKWQILNFDNRLNEIPFETALKNRFLPGHHAIEARIYAEDPESQYAPSPGRITQLNLPTFNGVRCDFGFRDGDVILPHYDPMIGKLIVTGTSREEALIRLERALSEIYIKGVITNVNQLLKIVRNEEFRSGSYTNYILAQYPELSNPVPNERQKLLAAVFASLAEHVNVIENTAERLLGSKDLVYAQESLHEVFLPESYEVDVYGDFFDVEFFQNALNSYIVFVNSTYVGEFELTPKLDDANDYLIRLGTQYYPIRIDAKSTFTILRMRDEDSRTHYLKLKISARGKGARKDPAGMQRSPFQATFVAFEKDKDEKPLETGSYVEKDQPIMIISAMKMETTLTAPVAGKISYFIEDGDLNRLVIGRTADGHIIGKSINEGEPLFIIEAEGESEEKESAAKESSVILLGEPNALYERLAHANDDSFDDLDVTKLLPLIFRTVKAAAMGLYFNPAYFAKLSRLLSKVDYKALSREGETGALIKTEFESLLAFYTGVKQIFATTIDSDRSFFGEMHLYLENWEDLSYRPYSAFKVLISTLIREYGLQEWQAKPERNNTPLKLAIFHILYADHNQAAVTSYLRMLIPMLDVYSELPRPLSQALRRLIMIEQAERDTSLATEALGFLRSHQHSGYGQSMAFWLPSQYLREYRKTLQDPLSIFGEIDRDQLFKKLSQSIEKGETPLIPKEAPAWLKKKLEQRFEILEKKYSITRLYSPTQDVVIYSLENKEDGKRSYFPVGHMEGVRFDRDEAGNIVGSPDIEGISKTATKVMRAYQSVEEREGSWIEVFLGETPIEAYLISFAPDEISYVTLSQVAQKVMPFFTNTGIERTVVNARVKEKYSGEIQERRISFAQRHGKLHLDLLVDEMDARSPYFIGEENPRVQTIFNRDKWPVEIWIREMFDAGIAEEIRIPSIDETRWVNPKTNAEEVKPVGSKIFTGNIDERPALFYLKDSRISGGATGNLEGLKYVAAAYLAWRKNIPFYVWNDGAGANIKEGMVSLNRAGEGFMVNTILGMGEAANPAEYLLGHPDKRLRELKEEVDSFAEVAGNSGEPVFTVAVGVGSSTGLDVYGSSQAAIQVMLDTEESYRVLTGSNVIRSVTGEDLTNYEIGGAPVLGRQTGSVDVVAPDKLTLLSSISRIHYVFSAEKSLPGIQRKEIPVAKNGGDRFQILNREIIERNVDDGVFLPVKEEYYGSGSLIGGFARLGGRKVLIMGPRTNLGINSFPAVTKAKEMSRIADKTGAAKILVYGSTWFHRNLAPSDTTLRARMDLVKNLSERKAGSVYINIITEVTGIQRIALNSYADATIYVVKEGEEMDEIVQNTATFIVQSLEEAFDVAQRLVEVLDPLSQKREAKESSEKPALPEEINQPYDVLSQVIHRTFDEGSFLEFFKDMNDPASGPALITGIARLDGQEVAVLADQPSIMGGAPDARGTEKYRIFMEIMNRHNVPVVMLSNAPGFVPGSKQERLRIQQIGGESLDVNIEGRQPIASVVLKQNYGGRQIHAFSRFIRPGIVYLALRKSVMAVMGASASYDLFFGKKHGELVAEGKQAEADKMRKDYIESYNEKASAENDAFSTGVLDWLINDIALLRSHARLALALASHRVEAVFGKTRGFTHEGDLLVDLLALSGESAKRAADGVKVNGKVIDAENESAFLRGELDIRDLI